MSTPKFEAEQFPLPLEQKSTVMVHFSDPEQALDFLAAIRRLKEDPQSNLRRTRLSSALVHAQNFEIK